MSWTGGTQIGDLFDNGHEYYPRKINKGAVAHTKGLLLVTDATGNAIVAPTTAARQPFYVAYEASLTADKRQHVWAAEGQWLVLPCTEALVPNDVVKVSTTVAGKIGKFVKGTDVFDARVGVYLGTIDLGADLTSGDVVQDTSDPGDPCVIRFGGF